MSAGKVSQDPLGRLERHHLAVVAGPGQLVELVGGRAEGPLQGRSGGGGDVADGAQAVAGQHVDGGLAGPPEGVDRQRVQEREGPPGRDDQQAVRLAAGRGQLGQELAGGDADGQGQPGLPADPVPQQPGRGHGVAEQRPRPADVQEGLVEREWLDQRGDALEDAHHRGRDPPVGGEVGRDGHRLGAQAAGSGHRHGVAAAERPRLIGGRGDHPAPAGPADQQRAAPQGRVLLHLDAGVEGVQVGVEDPQPVGLAGLQRPPAGDHLTGRPHRGVHGVQATWTL